MKVYSTIKNKILYERMNLKECQNLNNTHTGNNKITILS